MLTVFDMQLEARRAKGINYIMTKKNLHYFETIAQERDKWKEKNKYYWEDLDKLCSFLGDFKIIEIPIQNKERTHGTINNSRFKQGIILLKMCPFVARKIKFL